MFENRVLRYLLYGTSTAVVSQIIYSFYKYFEDYMSVDRTEIAEVIWTNELTQCCTHGQKLSNKQSILNSPKSNQIVAKCDNRYCAAYNVGRLIELISKSVYSIDLAMYTFTSFDLSNAIVSASERGVIVRIISDKEMVYSSGSRIINLTKADIAVRYPTTSNLMHHKFCIVDGNTRAITVKKHSFRVHNRKPVKGLLMTGSLNWTMQGFGANWENILVTSNKKLVQEYEDEFERMWKAFAPKNFNAEKNGLNIIENENENKNKNA